MSFQNILNIQQSLTVNNRRVVGQQVSRSGQLRVAQYLTAVPWVFTVRPHEFLYYPQVRNIIQTIDNLDRQLPETITFNTANLEWFTKYQGTLTTEQADALTLNAVPSPNSQILEIGNLPSVSAIDYVFKAGDFIQVEDYVYKVTEDVLRGSGTTVEVPIHRPIIGTPTTGTLAAIGQKVEFIVVAEQCPTYTLNPMANGAYVKWDSDFVFREYIIG